MGMENVVGIFGGLGIAFILTLVILVSEFVWWCIENIYIKCHITNNVSGILELKTIA